MALGRDPAGGIRGLLDGLWWCPGLGVNRGFLLRYFLLNLSNDILVKVVLNEELLEALVFGAPCANWVHRLEYIWDTLLHSCTRRDEPDKAAVTARYQGLLAIENAFAASAVPAVQGLFGFDSNERVGSAGHN